MIRKILARMRQAIEYYNMISDGDKIAIGVSGGKDSQLLLISLQQLSRFLPQKFEFVAITIDLGFESFSRDELLEFYDKYKIDYHIEETNISQVVFDVKNEANPCSLCSNMKRGAIHNAAKRLGCNKIAFAHHKDDVIETFLMSLIYEGNIHTFAPVTYLDRRDITLIRPLIYTDESIIRSTVENLRLKPIINSCPMDGHSKRQIIKELITSLAEENRHIKSNIFGAIKRSEIYGWKL